MLSKSDTLSESESGSVNEPLGRLSPTQSYCETLTEKHGTQLLKMKVPTRS